MFTLMIAEWILSVEIEDVCMCFYKDILSLISDDLIWCIITSELCTYMFYKSRGAARQSSTRRWFNCVFQGSCKSFSDLGYVTADVSCLLGKPVTGSDVKLCSACSSFCEFNLSLLLNSAATSQSLVLQKQYDESFRNPIKSFLWWMNQLTTTCQIHWQLTQKITFQSLGFIKLCFILRWII